MEVQWISVEERLPEIGVRVLTIRDWRGEPSVEIMWRSPKGKFRNLLGSEIDGITHWMPLPEPPHAR